MDGFGVLADRRLGAVCRHWKDLVRDGLPPARQALDPGAFMAALPFLWICERQGGSGRLVVRLAGEAINALFGRTVRGRFLDEILPPPLHGELVAAVGEVLAGPAALLARGRLSVDDPGAPLADCAILPLRDGPEIRSVLGATVYDAQMATPPGRLLPAIKERVLVPVAEL
jgi:hypothetical protein